MPVGVGCPSCRTLWQELSQAKREIERLQKQLEQCKNDQPFPDEPDIDVSEEEDLEDDEVPVD